MCAFDVWLRMALLMDLFMEWFKVRSRCIIKPCTECLYPRTNVVDSIY